MSIHRKTRLQIDQHQDPGRGPDDLLQEFMQRILLPHLLRLDRIQDQQVYKMLVEAVNQEEDQLQRVQNKIYRYMPWVLNFM